MTGPSDNTNDALTVLLTERSRFEGWLAALESRRATTPPHVFERVRLDYDARLRTVNEQLAGRASELQASVASLAERVASLHATENARRDERAEAELRSAVGEYGDDETRSIVERCDRAIAEASGERAALSAELARVQDILAQVTGGRPAQAAGSTAASRPRGFDPRQSPAALGAVIPPQTPPSVPAQPAVGLAGFDAGEPGFRRTGAFDDLAFLQGVTERGAGADLGAAGLAEPHGAVSGSADVSLASTVGQRASAPPADIDVDLLPSTILPARRANTPPRAAAAVRETNGSRARPATLTPHGLPAFLKDVPSEQSKTLKCQECGTMNYPTEWYCERCGGELAAL